MVYVTVSTQVSQLFGVYKTFVAVCVATHFDQLVTFVTANVSKSTSVSFVSTATDTCVTCGVVAVSSTATGSSFTAVISISIVYALVLHAVPSLTLNVKSVYGAPFPFKSGLNFKSAIQATDIVVFADTASQPSIIPLSFASSYRSQFPGIATISMFCNVPSGSVNGKFHATIFISVSSGPLILLSLLIGTSFTASI